MEQINKTSWKKLTREDRGKLLLKQSRITQTPWGWRVRSQTNTSIDYFVRIRNHKTKCSCPDCQIRKQKCKHIYAVEFYLKREIDKKGKVTEKKGIKITYGQKWSAYNKSQLSEKLVFMRLLRDLCTNIEQPKYSFGRPNLPYSDMIFGSVMKIYTTFSLRRFMSDMIIAKEKNLIDKVPCYSSLSNFMNKEDITTILKDLVKLSSLPLSSVEIDFTADSSGFSTSRFARYFDYKWGKESKYRIWIKAHLISGVRTNIITGVEITEGRANDSPQLASLVKQTAENFNMEEVSCDRAYSSRKNLQLIKEVGALPFVPFKSNAKKLRSATTIWGKMYHYFMYKHEEFLQHYHKRSNSETVFHMIKTKFRDNLRSKKKTAQINELLCKILCHNICVVIQEINELGLKTTFIKEQEESYNNER